MVVCPCRVVGSNGHTTLLQGVDSGEAEQEQSGQGSNGNALCFLLHFSREPKTYLETYVHSKDSVLL